MSLQTIIGELDNIKNELMRLNSKRASLLKRKKEIESEISSYIKNKKLPGIKYNGVAIVIEEKVTHERKSHKKSIEDSIRLLESQGIKSPRKLLDDLALMRKGDETVSEKIKTLKPKNKK